MDTFKIVAFKLGDEEYGINIDYVQSIERINQFTRVPNAPDYVIGVINLRGNVTPIIDLRSRLNLEKTRFTENTRVMIIRYGEIEIGLTIDQTRDVIDVEKEEVESATNSGLDSDYFSGVAKLEGRLIILLKIEELMKTETL
jgi:purine-binding chemotaxis protein CheW